MVEDFHFLHFGCSVSHQLLPLFAWPRETLTRSGVVPLVAPVATTATLFPVTSCAQPQAAIESPISDGQKSILRAGDCISNLSLPVEYVERDLR